MAQISEFLSDGREDVSGKTLRFAGQRGLNQLSGPCLFTADDAATFRAELNHSELGTQSIDWFRATPYRCERSAQRIEQYPTDFMQFGFPQSGSFTLSQEGRTETIGPGAAGFFRSSVPYEYETPGVSSIIQVAIPAERLPPHLRSLHAPRPVDFADSPIAEAFSALISALSKALPDADSPEAAYLQRALVDICVAVLTEAIDDHPSPMADDRVRFRVREHIQRHLSDPNLGPQSIAEDLNMSVRNLHLLFSGEEQTVGRYIRLVRLEAIAEELRSPHSAHAVSTLATRFGFRGPDQLARAFRAVYGTSMTQYRDAEIDATD